MDKLILKSNDIDIEILLHYPIVFIEGNSGVGKTYFLNYLNNILNDDYAKKMTYSNFDLNKTRVYLGEVPDNIYQLSGYIIFIDRFDMFATSKLIDFVDKSNNIFILFPRGDDISGIKVISDSYLSMQSKKINDKMYLRAYPLAFNVPW